MYDNPRIFLKSILKPLKGFEIAFEYTFDKNIYDYSWYTGSVVYTTVQGGKDTTPTNDYLQKRKDIPTITQSTCMVLMISHWVIISLR